KPQFLDRTGTGFPGVERVGQRGDVGHDKTGTGGREPGNYAYHANRDGRVGSYDQLQDPVRRLGGGRRVGEYGDRGLGSVATGADHHSRTGELVGDGQAVGRRAHLSAARCPARPTGAVALPAGELRPAERQLSRQDGRVTVAFAGLVLLVRGIVARLGDGEGEQPDGRGEGTGRERADQPAAGGLEFDADVPAVGRAQ